MLLAIFIFFFNQKKFQTHLKNFFDSRETGILVNNWFMMYFLSVVLVGTAYPIFLEVINNSKISVGPPFYHKLIIPFLIPFLFFMAMGPNLKWIKNEKKTLNFLQLIIFFICLIVSYLIILKTDTNFLF